MVLDIMKRDPEIDMLRVKKALSALDSSVYGGAPLLGVRGISMICHGNSTSRAIKNAIGAAVRAFETKMNDRIGEKLAQAAQNGDEEKVAS
jgi:glycerol-3-phosphate acyltransferase PlsX